MAVMSEAKSCPSIPCPSGFGRSISMVRTTQAPRQALQEHILLSGPVACPPTASQRRQARRAEPSFRRPRGALPQFRHRPHLSDWYFLAFFPLPRQIANEIRSSPPLGAEKPGTTKFPDSSGTRATRAERLTTNDGQATDGATCTYGTGCGGNTADNGDERDTETALLRLPPTMSVAAVTGESAQKVLSLVCHPLHPPLPSFPVQS